ncbi:MAG TPA: hypothetical protein VHT00_01220 [Stellaceae bacterium]|jgi:hypothetical protein|nr:hypothetical protein [Stellaceae bacterium]
MTHRMRLVGFKPVVKNSLRGFCAIELPCGLIIEDIPLNLSHGKPWAALPSKPVLDRDGRQVETGGKKQYASLLRWNSRELGERWSQAVVELVRQHHPEALDERGAS